MSALFQTMLSRRNFIKGGAALSLVFVAACDQLVEQDEEATEEPTPTIPTEPTPEQEPTATPTPEPAEPEPTLTPEPTPSPEPTATPTPEPSEPVSYWIDPQLNIHHSVLVQRAVDLIVETFDDDDLEIVRVAQSERADIQIYDPGENHPDRFPLTGEPLIPVVRTDHLIDQIQLGDLQALFARAIESWAGFGGQDWDVYPAISQSIVAPHFARGSEAYPHSDLVALSREHPGMIALIPRSAASMHVQSLIVDDVDPVRDELTSDNWPWWEQIDITVDANRTDVLEELIEAIESENASVSAGRRTMLTITGDVMLGRTPHRIMVEQNDWAAPYPLVADELQKGDLIIGNLECAITDSFEPPADPTTFSFMTFTDAVEGLQFAGYHALSGANNHSLDFGVVGMRDTTAALQAGGIQHFGTGDNLEEARQPCLLEYDGVTFAFLGYDAISMQYAGATAETGGVAPMIQEYVVEDIQRAREIADVVIPYFHWGIEYTLTPTENDRRMAYAAVEAGADLVLGGHPHWVQGMEIYQDTAIFYSTANFVFDQEWSFETKQSFVLHLIFDGTQFIGYRVVPALIEDFHRPRIVEDEVRNTILGRFWESSSIIANNPLS